MKKKIIIILVLLAVIMVPVGFKCYDTYKKYTVPEEIYYGVGESFEYKGLRYELKDMETYDFDGLIERFGLQESAEHLRELEALNLYDRKYFVATLDLTALVEKTYGDSISEIEGYCKYNAGGSMSLFLMQAINGTFGCPNMDVGETVEYYAVFNAIDIYYTDETFEKLDVDDVYLRILDMSTGQAYCMQKK